MEIYLRIELGRSGDSGPRSADPVGTRHLGDVVLRVEPTHTIADVGRAIAAFFTLDGSRRLPVSRAGSGPLDETMTVVDVGLLTGQTLILGTTDWPELSGLASVELVIASGPDAGLSHPLSPGATLVIGRGPDCDVALTDPQVSRRHLLLSIDAEGAVSVEPAAAVRNEARTDGEPVRARRSLVPGQVVRFGASSLVVRNRGKPPPADGDSFGNVAFHRTPYFSAPVREAVVSAMQEVPTTPEKTRLAYLSAAMPLVIGIAFALLFGPRYLLFALFSPVMLVANHLEQRRRTGRTFARSVERFHEELEEKSAEVSIARSVERRRRFEAAPDSSALADRACRRSSELWIRARDVADFLTVRVGLGDVPAALQVQAGDGGDLEYRDRVDAVLGPTEVMTDVPVTLDLSELGVIGVVGAAGDTTALVSSLVVQACCLHSPEDLVVLSASAPDRAMTDWLRWMPHARTASSPLAGPHVVEDKQGADALLAELVDEVATRRSASRAATTPSARPWLLVLIDRALEPDPALVSRLLDGCPANAVSVVWLTDTATRVPRQARAVVHCQPPASGLLSEVSFTDPDRPRQALDLDRVAREQAGTVARSLAPLRDASLSNGATALPRTVSLFGALGAESIDVDWVCAQWRADRGYSLPTSIGFGDTGPMEVDIVEHGPHGLIGGTSGSGKSELVMSMVAGLIARNPPTRVNFLFIDYKGGASSDLFAHAPHTVGYVTNLDGLLAMRALTSLRAELNRRMNLLQGRAKDLSEMIERFPTEAPPSLVIVVDEFATLVKEIPDFITGIVDIAQRGRSLGIHLLLATQRPSGSVNDNIKANTNLRISLRMLDGAESSAVIGVPDAAAIPGPLKGRGYISVGSGELTAFQSAWAGAPLLAASGRPPVTVQAFGRPRYETDNPEPLSSRAQPGEPPVSRGGDTPGRLGGPTQIGALLAAVSVATERLGLSPGRPPWLEMLAPVISIEALRDRVGGPEGEDGRSRGPNLWIPFGMIDDPAAQAQYRAVLDLAGSGGLLVSGAGGSGKSTALRTIVISAAMDDSTRGGGRLTVFAIDFTSQGLGALSRLPQCAAVATGDDIEAVTRIIRLLHGELERRRKAMADAVARGQPQPVEPTVLLVIDGMDAATQAMELGPGAGGLAPYHAELIRLLSEGRQVGIQPIISTTRQSAIRAGVSSAIGARLTLRQADPQGYLDCGIGAADAKELDLKPGQGFIDGTKLIQVATLTEPSAENGSASPQASTELGFERFGEAVVELTGWVDPRLETAALPARLGLLPTPDLDDNPMRPIIGRADLTSAPFALDLRYDNVSIVGDPRSGRSTALATIGRQAAAAGAEVLALGRPGSPLEQVVEPLRCCFEDGEPRQRFLEASLEELLEGRAARQTGGQSPQPSLVQPAPPPVLLLLDDYDLLPEHDRPLLTVIEQLLGTVRYVAAGTVPRGFSSNPISQLIRGSRSMVYLRPTDARTAQEVLGVPVPWHPGLAMVEGRGMAVVDRVATIVQFSDAFSSDR